MIASGGCSSCGAEDDTLCDRCSAPLCSGCAHDADEGVSCGGCLSEDASRRKQVRHLRATGALEGFLKEAP